MYKTTLVIPKNSGATFLRLIKNHILEENLPACFQWRKKLSNNSRPRFGGSRGPREADSGRWADRFSRFVKRNQYVEEKPYVSNIVLPIFLFTRTSQKYYQSWIYKSRPIQDQAYQQFSRAKMFWYGKHRARARQRLFFAPDWKISKLKVFQKRNGFDNGADPRTGASDRKWF